MRHDSRPDAPMTTSAALPARRLRRATQAQALTAAAICALAGAVSAQAQTEDRLWRVSPEGLVLDHAAPETDDRDFLAICREGHMVDLLVIRSLPGLEVGGKAEVMFAHEQGVASYPAKGEMVEGLGAVMPVAQLPASDPLWIWMRQGGELTVTLNGNVDYVVSLKDAAEAVVTFQETCLGET